MTMSGQVTDDLNEQDRRHGTLNLVEMDLTNVNAVVGKLNMKVEYEVKRSAA